MLVTDQAAARDLVDQGYNLFSGTIGRSIYFGDAVDYVVELASGGSLRVVAPAAQKFAPNQSIIAAAHADHCVVVRDD
jgi:hypothetical protein